jgi:ABC-type transporter Mla subunit MlaD
VQIHEGISIVMAIINEIAQNPDENSQKLTEFMRLLDDVCAGIDAEMIKVERSARSLNDLNSDAEEHLQALITNILQIISKLSTKSDDTIHSLQTLHQDSGVLEQRLTYVTDMIDQLHHEVSSELDDSHKQLQESSQSLFSASNQLQNSLGDLLDSATAISKKTQYSFNMFGTDLQTLSQEMATHHVQILGNLSQFQEALAGSHTQAIKYTFSTLAHSLVDEHAQQLEHELNSMGKDLGQHLGTFQNQANALGEQLQQQMSAKIEELVNEVEGSIGAKLESFYQNLSQRIVEAVEEEITETLCANEAGIAVTNAVSPILPEMIAINLLLDIIDAIS